MSFPTRFRWTEKEINAGRAGDLVNVPGAGPDFDNQYKIVALNPGADYEHRRYVVLRLTDAKMILAPSWYPGKK
jgi:hypothetical protein